MIAKEKSYVRMIPCILNNFEKIIESIFIVYIFVWIRIQVVPEKNRISIWIFCHSFLPKTAAMYVRYYYNFFCHNINFD